MKALLILAALTACAPVHAQDAPPEPQCAPYDLLVAGLQHARGLQAWSELAGALERSVGTEVAKIDIALISIADLGRQQLAGG